MTDGTIRSYRDLDAWRISMDLCILTYETVSELPPSERFELSSQMRRAAVSVPSNVAEGQACGQNGRYIHHLRIALGSLGELGSQVEVARRLALLPSSSTAEMEEHLARAGQVVHGLLRSRLRRQVIRRVGCSALLACFGLWLVASPILG